MYNKNTYDWLKQLTHKCCQMCGKYMGDVLKYGASANVPWYCRECSEEIKILKEWKTKDGINSE